MDNNKRNGARQNSNKGKPLVRKPSLKNRKPPEVKQTLTSKYRLLKANPLLMHELEKAFVNNNKADEQFLSKPLKTLATVLDASTNVPTGIPGKIPTEKASGPDQLRNKPKVEIYPRPAANFNHANVTKSDFKPGHFLSSTIIENKQESNMKPNVKKFAKPATSGNKPAAVNGIKETKVKEPLRRSLSAQHLDKQKKTVVTLVNQTATKSQSGIMRSFNPRTASSIRKSQSFEELRKSIVTTQNPNPRTFYSARKSQSFEELRKSTKIIDPKPGTARPVPKSLSSEELRKSVKIDELNISTITEESSFNTSLTPQPLFRTPRAQNRRSSVWTPNTNNRRSLFLNSPSSNDMSRRLSEWLQRRGKSLGDYHHLRCFGLHGHGKKPEVVNIVDEENKENVETEVVDRSSYEELAIAVKPGENDEGAIAPQITVDLEAVAKEALQDLHQLILEGYPGEQCDAWLRLMKGKYSKLEEEPQYWECRAALEQSKGNINNAVECYKTAIIQGAEVQAVDKSLDQLLQKFSLLNINKDIKTNNENKERARIVQDARNIFKSSIIQFAVQERVLKKKNSNGVTRETEVTATPVRRSTRLSRSAFTSTPGVKVFSSLQEASKSTPHTIRFQHNKALND